MTTIEDELIIGLVSISDRASGGVYEDLGIPALESWLSAAIRTGQRFGAGHLIDVLLGKRTPKVEQWSHDELPTFGVGADVSDREWRSVVRQLVARGMLSPDPARMGALTVAEAARPVLEGAATVQLRRVAAPVARAKKARSAYGATAPAASSADNALFERLRALRRELADADGVPAYVVLPDRTLWELVATKPSDVDGLLAVNGIGPVKAEKYGAKFLELLAEAV